MSKIVKILAMVALLSLIAAICVASKPVGNIDQEKADRNKVLSKDVKEKAPADEKRHNVEDIYAASNSAREIIIEQLHNARKQGDNGLAKSILEELAKDFPSDKISHEGITEPKATYYNASEEAGTSPVISPLWTKNILVAGTSNDETNPVIAVDERNGIMYAALENWQVGGKIDIYKSTDGGNTWYKHMTIDSASQPSITVAYDTLLVAFVYNYVDLYVYHEKDGVGTFALVDHSNNGLLSPDIISDSSQYIGWYSYITYNTFDGTNYYLRAGRSTDLSGTYSTQKLVSYGSSFIPGSPSIDYGENGVYIAYEKLWVIGDRDTYLTYSTDNGISYPNSHCAGCTSSDEYEPSVAAAKNAGTTKTVIVAYTRTVSDNDIYYIYSLNGGTNWAGESCLFCSTGIEEAPDLATDLVGGRIHAAIWENYDIKYTSADYTNPSSWTPGVIITDSSWASGDYPRPSIASNPTKVTNSAVTVWTDFRGSSFNIYFDSGGNVLNTYVRGTDNALWYRQYDGATWGSWTSLGGIINSDPDAVSYNGKRYVFARGTDNALWYRTYEGTSWSGWTSLGGNINSAPGVAEANGRLNVFSRGTDNALWYRTYDGTSWSGWTSLGGALNSGPGAMRLGTPISLLYVFASGTDNALWYRTYDGTSWSGWTSLGGTISYDPDATALNGRIYAFSRGNDGALWYRSSDGTSWGGWTSLGGSIQLSPGVATFGNDAYIFARGTDSALWYRTLSGGWQSLGGIVNSGPGVTN
jgi:hypothetical protein